MLHLLSRRGNPRIVFFRSHNDILGCIRGLLNYFRVAIKFKPSFKYLNSLGSVIHYQLVHLTSIMIRVLICMETTHKDVSEIEVVIPIMFLIHYDNIEWAAKVRMFRHGLHNILCCVFLTYHQSWEEMVKWETSGKEGRMVRHIWSKRKEIWNQDWWIHGSSGY